MMQDLLIKKSPLINLADEEDDNKWSEDSEEKDLEDEDEDEESEDDNLVKDDEENY